MNVVVSVWSDWDALAHVDGTRVRIRRRGYTVRWMCDEHGTANNDPEHCPHTAALAATPAPLELHRSQKRRSAGTTDQLARLGESPQGKASQMTEESRS